MGKPLSLPLEPKSNSAGIVILVVSPGACSEQLSSELSCYFQGEKIYNKYMLNLEKW